MNARIVLSVILLASAAKSAGAVPLGTAFLYQGQVAQNGNPLNGTADFEFSLYDAASNGVFVGSLVTASNVTVVDGLFALELDFGVNVFNGEERWLEMSVRSPAGAGAYTTLSPRQPIAPTPYALQTRGMFVDDAGNVLIGESGGGEEAPAGLIPSKLSAVNPSAGRTAIVGQSTATTGVTDGVKGTTLSDAGRGLVGEANAGSGDTCGVYGKSTSPDGDGIFGEATATSGDARGVCGKSVSSSGVGVYGEADSADGATRGVHGKSASSDGEGVFGEATATSGTAAGVCGKSMSSNGVGVFGEAQSDDGTTRGVYGRSASSDGEGVFGEATATSGTAAGVCGKSMSSNGVGVFGEAEATAGATRGVHGRNNSNQGEGVFGEATATTGEANGVCGRSASSSGAGVVGEAMSTTGTAYGVRGMSMSDDGGAGVYGEAMGSSGGAGVFGDGPTGVRGTSFMPNGVGIKGEGNTGVEGVSSASGNGIGVYGTVPYGSTGVGVQGDGGTGVRGNSFTPNGVGVRGEGETGVVGIGDDVANGGVGVSGLGPKYGVVGENDGSHGCPTTASGCSAGVLGHGSMSLGYTYGVIGRIDSDNPKSAGVRAEGGGVGAGPGMPGAAALEIYDGAIRVSGDLRPAGTLHVHWSPSHPLDTCSGDHFGHYQDWIIPSPLITDSSIILVTVEEVSSLNPTSVYFASIYYKNPGSVVIRITGMDDSGCGNPPVDLDVHYLIINPDDEP